MWRRMVPRRPPRHPQPWLGFSLWEWSITKGYFSDDMRNTGWWELVAMNLAFSHMTWECHHPN